MTSRYIEDEASAIALAKSLRALDAAQREDPTTRLIAYALADAIPPNVDDETFRRLDKLALRYARAYAELFPIKQLEDDDA